MFLKRHPSPLRRFLDKRPPPVETGGKLDPPKMTGTDLQNRDIGPRFAELWVFEDVHEKAVHGYHGVEHREPVITCQSGAYAGHRENQLEIHLRL